MVLRAISRRCLGRGGNVWIARAVNSCLCGFLRQGTGNVPTFLTRTIVSWLMPRASSDAQIYCLSSPYVPDFSRVLLFTTVCLSPNVWLPRSCFRLERYEHEIAHVWVLRHRRNMLLGCKLSPALSLSWLRMVYCCRRSWIFRFSFSLCSVFPEKGRRKAKICHTFEAYIE